MGTRRVGRRVKTMRRQKQEQRRKKAVARYLADEKVEDICRVMRCSTAWLYKWLNRYSADNPEWFIEQKRIPKTVPSRTPGRVEQVIRELRRTGLTGAQIAERLKQEGINPLPSLRTIYRVIGRNK